MALALVTGSTDGIGEHTALQLARQGFRVIVHGRSPARCEAARARIVAAHPAAALEVVCSDLSTLAGARALVSTVTTLVGDGALTVLVNNAGVYEQARRVTADGLEMTFAVNVAALFIVLVGLLPLVERAHVGRVLNVSSISHEDIASLDISDLQLAKPHAWSAGNAYAASKMAVCMLSHEAALRVSAQRSPSGGRPSVVIMSCDPGTVDTKMVRAGWPDFEGALAIADANDEATLVSTCDSAKHGLYFVYCVPTPCSRDVYNAPKRRALWAACEAICGVSLTAGASVAPPPAGASAVPPLLPPAQKGPSVWDAASPVPPPWLLSAEELAALRECAAAVVAASAGGNGDLSLPAVDAAAAALPRAFSARLACECNEELLHGRGWTLLRGLPVAAWGDELVAAAFLVLTRALGALRQQNRAGHVLGHVTDLGLSSSDPNVRVYQTSERQTFHTDSCDVVALLMLRPARSGGESFLVSAGAVFNALRTRRPDLLALLLEPLATDRRGEVPAGALPYFCIPPFSLHKGALNVIYQRQYIDSAQRFPDAPRLTPAHIEALDALDALLNDPAMHVRMTLAPGDVQLVHNHALLHDRSAFVDDPHAPRHLLRAWIAPPGARPLPPAFAQRFGSVEVGARGGVQLEGVAPVARWRPPPRAAPAVALAM